MHSDILDKIKLLTKEDRKTLSQKVLKVGEEFGELARVALPLDNAHGTRHRLPRKSAVLEEVSDIILTALSVAYDLGFSDEEIADMMLKKTIKWSGLQFEQTGDGKVPHEIHVTVETDRYAEDFAKDCKFMGVKPVILHLHTADGDIREVMTSQVVIDTTSNAFAALENTNSLLRFLGYKVIREKIEVAPWHPAVPHHGEANTDENYFECHVEVTGKIDDLQFESDMAVFADSPEIGLSTNRGKIKPDAGTYTKMLTLRQYKTTGEAFTARVKALHEQISALPSVIDIKKPLVEYSIYDKGEQQDRIWLESK